LKSFLELSILTDNTAGGRFLAEHGFSVFLRMKAGNVLFDSGHSDVFLKNAAVMGISLPDEINAAVLSHGHWDHGDGFAFLDSPGLPLYAHPSAFIRRYRSYGDRGSVGLSMRRPEFARRFELIEHSDPFEIQQNVWFLGTIPRVLEFEPPPAGFIDESGAVDLVPDDSAMAVRIGRRIVVISGCAHSGICNIVEHALAVTGADEVEAVIGGFHLKDRDERTLKTVRYFHDKGIRRIHPSHCTALPALSLFFDEFGSEQIKTGMTLNF
jgi:7,8-dihydropterin-6-yl-methyl-4-(beta-D-ribofuranosyl)aminobenzene 5'-phosphate synthase